MLSGTEDSTSPTTSTPSASPGPDSPDSVAYLRNAHEETDPRAYREFLFQKRRPAEAIDLQLRDIRAGRVPVDQGIFEIFAYHIAYNQRGQARRLVQQIEDLLESVRAEPAHAEGLFQVGLMLYGQNMFKAALDYFKKITAILRAEGLTGREIYRHALLLGLDCAYRVRDRSTMRALSVEADYLINGLDTAVAPAIREGMNIPLALAYDSLGLWERAVDYALAGLDTLPDGAPFSQRHTLHKIAVRGLLRLGESASAAELAERMYAICRADGQVHHRAAAQALNLLSRAQKQQGLVREARKTRLRHYAHRLTAYASGRTARVRKRIERGLGKRVKGRLRRMRKRLKRLL